jgi:hypothetical protein
VVGHALLYEESDIGRFITLPGVVLLLHPIEHFFAVPVIKDLRFISFTPGGIIKDTVAFINGFIKNKKL